MKKLVIYFSHTGENYMSDGIRNIDKGNTEIVAEKLLPKQEQIYSKLKLLKIILMIIMNVVLKLKKNCKVKQDQS